jgi:plasmid stability protein
MRTTLTLDDDLAAALKENAYQKGKSFKAMVNEVLRAGLAHLASPPKARPYTLEPVDLGGVAPGVDLNKALQLADALEDEEMIRELKDRR